MGITEGLITCCLHCLLPWFYLEVKTFNFSNQNVQTVKLLIKLCVWWITWLMKMFFNSLSVVWLPQDLLWTIDEKTASITSCKSLQKQDHKESHDDAGSQNLAERISEVWKRNLQILRARRYPTELVILLFSLNKKCCNNSFRNIKNWKHVRKDL